MDKHRAALTVYDGLVFKNIEADDFSEEDMLYAQEHLRILSGFYGVVKLEKFELWIEAKEELL